MYLPGTPAIPTSSLLKLFKIFSGLKRLQKLPGSSIQFAN